MGCVRRRPTGPAVMNSLPPGDRGAGAGMNATFQNSAQVLSIGIFFSLMIVGLAVELPDDHGQRAWSPTACPADAQRVAHLPPVSILFAAFLGYNPIKTLLGPRCSPSCPPANARPPSPGAASSPTSSPARSAPASTRCSPSQSRAAWSPPASWSRGKRFVYGERSEEAMADDDQTDNHSSAVPLH